MIDKERMALVTLQPFFLHEIVAHDGGLGQLRIPF
jgi:hypothetical protein